MAEALREGRPVQPNRRLTKKERDALEKLMEVRDPHFTGPMGCSLTRVHGFLTAIVSGPMVLPSQWIPMVFGDDEDNVWEAMEQAQRAMNLLMRFYNEIVSDLGQDSRGYGILVNRIGDRPDTFDLADDWCKGYVLGFTPHEDAWNEAIDDSEVGALFLPILVLANPETAKDFDPVKKPDEYAELLEALPHCALKICEWWRARLYPGTVRRAAPKVSPNARCPCGSGKKYKRCCSRP